ncbi:acyl carrier protein [Dehalococcoidia bacterium]|nr:acyl carrier protein [Dehalococcoidia bacterium]
MDVNAAVTIIKESINEIFAQDGVGVEITEEMPLIGGDSDLDSMKLVELCLVLEDKASDIGFEFDWTSDTAMSKSRSMFRSIRSLAIEFVIQCEAQA